MEHSRSSEASQEISRPLWKLKAHYRVHNSPQVDYILSKMSLVLNFPTYLFRIHSSIIILQTPTYSKWSHPFRFSH